MKNNIVYVLVLIVGLIVGYSANHDKMIKDLKNIFEKYNVNGEIAMEYDTLVYYGKL